MVGTSEDVDGNTGYVEDLTKNGGFSISELIMIPMSLKDIMSMPAARHVLDEPVRGLQSGIVQVKNYIYWSGMRYIDVVQILCGGRCLKWKR